MKFIEIRIKAFKALVDTRFRFADYSGLVGVEGRVSGGGFGSNSASKSSAFLDCPAWILFDRCVQDQESVDSVCNRALGYAEAEIDVELASGRIITAGRRRSGGKTVLTVTGLDSGTPSGKQESLERMLGFDYSLWTRTVAFRSGDAAFCKMKDSEKKEALERLLGLDQYSRAREIASEKARVARNTMENAQAKMTATAEAQGSVSKSLKRMEEEEQSYASRMAAQIREMEDDIAKTSEAVTEKYVELSNLGVQVAEEEKLYQKQHEAWRAGVVAAENAVDKARERSSETQSSVAVAEEKLKSARRELRHLLDKDHPDVCPTCAQAWPKDKSNAVVIESRRKQVREAEEEQQKALAEHDKNTEKVSSLKTKLEEIKEQEPVKGEMHEKWEALRETIEDELERDLKLKKQELSNLREHSKENPYTLQVQQLRDQDAVNKQVIANMESKVTEAARLVTLYEFWTKGFGKQGIPSYLIDNSIPFLNETVQRLTSVMTDGSIQIYFDPSMEGGREARGGQRLGVVVNNRDGGGFYKDQSTGEKGRIDIATLMAVRHLMAQRLAYGFDQLFIDEVFDGIDEEGVNRVVSLLRAEFPKATIFIITHKESLKGLMDHTVTVQKKGKVARILSGTSHAEDDEEAAPRIKKAKKVKKVARSIK